MLTNSSSPLARHLALEFARNGCRLALIDVSKRDAEDTVKWIKQRTKDEATVYPCNLADNEALETYVI